MTDALGAKSERYAEFDRRVGPWMVGLSIIFVVVFIVGFVPNVPASMRALCDEIGWAIWAMFALEFVVRLVLAPNRRHALRAHLFDLLVLVLPFLRAFRGVRAVRGVARAVLAVGGMTLSGRALNSTRRVARSRGVPYVIALVVMATLAGALIVLQVESGAPDRNIASLGDAVWWAVSTVTTVGYGDRYPTTTEGRVVAFALMLLGLGLFSLVTARIAAFFVGDEHAVDESRAALAAMENRLAEIENLLRVTAGQRGRAVEDGTKSV